MAGAGGGGGGGGGAGGGASAGGAAASKAAPSSSTRQEQASLVNEFEIELRNDPNSLRRGGPAGKGGDNVVGRLGGAFSDAVKSGENDDPKESATGGLASATLDAVGHLVKLSHHYVSKIKRFITDRDGISLEEMGDRDRRRAIDQLRRQREQDLARQQTQRSPIQDRLNRARMQKERAEAAGRPQRPAPGQARYRAAGSKARAMAGPSAGMAGAGAGLARGARIVHPLAILESMNNMSTKAIEFGKLAARKAPGMALSAAGTLMQLTRAARTSRGGPGPSSFAAVKARSVNVSASPQAAPSMSPQRSSQMGMGQSRGMEF